MYALTEIVINGLKYLKLTSSDGQSKATICLNQGGRLSDFMFETVQIFQEFQPSTYKDNYASAILFPFANRVKNGAYVFNNSSYKLNCNEANKQNAIHGLVYNKTFTCINKTFTSDYGSVTLQYKDQGLSKGFPFKYTLELTYILSEEGMTLTTKVLNEDEKTFPFTLGWHPYFTSTDLEHSFISFESQTKYVCDKHQIISGSTALNIEMPFQLKGINLDDGYKLETNNIEFLTPKYKVNFSTTSKENFLQLYTPQQLNSIAIEPMTGAVDNFNNKIGLQVLNPNQSYKLEWTLRIETLNTKTN